MRWILAQLSAAYNLAGAPAGAPPRSLLALARLPLLVIAALAAIYGYVTLALVLLGQSDDALWPAVAGSSGSLALVGLRAQHPLALHTPWARWQPLLVSVQIALAAGLASWAAASAALWSMGWPPDATLAAGELAAVLATLAAWPTARRLARHVVTGPVGPRGTSTAPGDRHDPT